MLAEQIILRNEWRAYALGTAFSADSSPGPWRATRSEMVVGGRTAAVAKGVRSARLEMRMESFMVVLVLLDGECVGWFVSR